MNKNRLEAFSDGVIAIIITIMVLEMKVPHGTELEDLKPLLPIFFSYLLSFIFIGIYWNNHHHMLHAVKSINGKALWANLHLLFWLSLIPFVTGWMGENHFASIPVGLYGVVLFMAGAAYYILARTLINSDSKNSVLAKALNNDIKGITSLVIYALAILVVFFNSWFSIALYILVALIWLVPDSRIERNFKTEK